MIFISKDIFVSQTREESFLLHEHSIQLYDGKDYFYEIDYTGKLLRDKSNQ